MINIKCPNCEYQGKAKYGRSLFIELFLLVTTWWIGWLPLIAYYIFVRRYKCPKCSFHHVVRM